MGPMRRLALALSLLLIGCASNPGPVPTPELTAASASSSTVGASASPSPSAPSAHVPSEATAFTDGVATDQPCTRTVLDEPSVADVSFQLQDLERMIPPPDEVAGLAGSVDDTFVHGYHDNQELRSIVPNPPSTCDLLVRFGRVTGFGVGYQGPGAPTHHVMFVVHLFADGGDTRAWSDAFFAGFAPLVGNPDGLAAFDVEQPFGLPPDAVLATHVGPDGIRSWAAIHRGPILGWVIDLHPERAPPFDVSAAARVLAGRIEAVSAAAAEDDGGGPDAAHLLSSPLPLAAWGDRGEFLTWDWFFGGCADAIERGLVVGEQARLDAERFGRVSGCTALYSPPGAPQPSGTIRLFSSVSLYDTEDGAAASMPASLVDLEREGGERFTVDGVGHEAIGLVTTDTGETRHNDTRITLRRGSQVGVVTVQTTDPADLTGELTDAARALEERMATYLGD
jgi:hypothetical protein